MKRATAILTLLLICLSMFGQRLVEDQLEYSRVRAAKADYHNILVNMFEEKNVTFPPKDIYIRTFKFDKALELWATEDGENYTLIKTYDVCQVSGELGPKRKQGDFQIPEGVYELEYFNPASNFHLSMKVNYPNESDRILGNKGNLGGDIFIHGECVTIGCIPLENEPIKELYWLSVLTKGNGGNIPIHIFPFRMDELSLKFFKDIPLFTKEDWKFWDQLKPIYAYFEANKKLPEVEIDEKGAYILANASKWAKN